MNPSELTTIKTIVTKFLVVEENTILNTNQTVLTTSNFSIAAATDNTLVESKHKVMMTIVFSNNYDNNYFCCREDDADTYG